MNRKPEPCKVCHVVPCQSARFAHSPVRTVESAHDTGHLTTVADVNTIPTLFLNSLMRTRRNVGCAEEARQKAANSGGLLGSLGNFFFGPIEEDAYDRRANGGRGGTYISGPSRMARKDPEVDDDMCEVGRSSTVVIPIAHPFR